MLLYKNKFRRRLKIEPKYMITFTAFQMIWPNITTQNTIHIANM